MPPSPPVAELESLLPRFGLAQFRRGQKEVIQSVLTGHDVLCVMPTGGGKSLCYQLPSLALSGATIVVSPLIALMKDQVDSLQTRGIHAALLNSTQSAGEQSDVMDRLAEGLLDLIYVAPERLKNNRFLDSVRRAKVTLLAIDEAHCISEWGHDFRPDYARLGLFRKRYLGDIQTIALTATATPVVRKDIADLLHLTDPKSFVTGFARENLRFSVTHCSGDRQKDSRLLEFLQKQTGSGIIYAATRKRCEELAQWLPEKLQRRVGVYHAGLESKQRRDTQEAFMQGDLPVIVATNAFGMGIDKSDLRYVVHYNIPGSLEAYYQEAGRAGRDGLPSECRLLFAYADRYVQEFFIENHYPSTETVRSIYHYLLSRKEDPIELTQQQIRDALGMKGASEAIGASETLLARTGVLKRLDSSANHSIIRIDSDLPTLLDLLPPEAKLRRRVMQACEKVIGKKRGEDVYVRPLELAQLANVDRDQLNRALRELVGLQAFDYVPPFRGRAIHFTKRDIPFEELEIDFDELNRRKDAEYAKLESVVSFARQRRCRQLAILNYFGDPEAKRCHTCDHCVPDPANVADTSAEAPVSVDNDQAILRGMRIALSGVARMHGRFGKLLVAQMLRGSQNKKIQQWKLNRLSTYGMLAGMQQGRIIELLDTLCQYGMAEQVEVDQRRPTIRLTPFGEQVMKGGAELPEHLRLEKPLALSLAGVGAKHEPGDVPGHRQHDGQMNPRQQGESENNQNRASSEDAELAERLKSWRRKTSAALATPAFRVLSNATIDRIVAQRPADTKQLEQIKGIGKTAIKQFGNDLINLIAPSNPPAVQADCHAPDSLASQTNRSAPETREPIEKLDQNPEPDLMGKKMGDSDAYWTWRLMCDGYSMDQVAAIRRMDRVSIIEHLNAASGAGQKIDIHWAASPSQIETLKNIIHSPQKGQKPSVKMLPSDIEPALFELARRVLKMAE